MSPVSLYTFKRILPSLCIVKQCRTLYSIVFVYRYIKKTHIQIESRAAVVLKWINRVNNSPAAFALKNTLAAAAAHIKRRKEKWRSHTIVCDTKKLFAQLKRLCKLSVKIYAFLERTKYGWKGELSRVTVPMLNWFSSFKDMFIFYSAQERIFPVFTL